jgi:cytosine permease
MDIPRMEDVEFTGVRWVGILAYVVGCVVAILTAGSVIPGVGAPQVIPGITSLNGIVAAAVVQVVGFYALERTGVTGGHEVAPDAERL